MGKKLRLHQKAEHLAYLQKAIAVARKTGACVVCMQPWSPLQGWEDLQIDALRALASLQAPEGQ